MKATCPSVANGCVTPTRQGDGYERLHGYCYASGGRCGMSTNADLMGQTDQPCGRCMKPIPCGCYGRTWVDFTREEAIDAAQRWQARAVAAEGKIPHGWVEVALFPPDEYAARIDAEGCHLYTPDDRGAFS